MNETLIGLADPKRRAMLRRLAQGEQPVTKLAAPIDVSLNAISKHITLLERAGLVQRRRSGRMQTLRFNPAPLGKVQDWIVKQRAFWQASLEAMDRMLQEEDQT